ncbi:MAG: hypothetical protein JWP97_3001 [Labilithrix sp.]|nr:hypothetical protein [Labilithrix sp.]
MRIPILRHVLVSVALAGPSLLAGCSSFAAAEDAPDATPDGPAERPDVDGGPAADGGGTDAAPDVILDASLPCDAGRSCDERFVFVTKGLVRGDFAHLPSMVPVLDAADAICAADANANTAPAVLKGRKWKALLCAGAGNAFDRLGAKDARWVLPERQVAWMSTASIRMSPPTVALGGVDKAWTGCDPLGEAISGATCNGWSATSGNGQYGAAKQASAEWSSAGAQNCSDVAPLYCFEDAP